MSKYYQIMGIVGFLSSIVTYPIDFFQVLIYSLIYSDIKAVKV